MPDLSAISQINGLLGEVRSLTEALEAFERGESIRSMMIASVSIDTTGWTYPPQMTEAIKAALTARREVVYSDLRELGFTGDYSPPPEPAP